MNLIIVGGGNSISAFPFLWKDLVDKYVISVNYAFKFMEQVPRWQFSIDRKFWFSIAKDIPKLEATGCELIGFPEAPDVSKTWGTDKIFCGGRKLSGLAALSWAVKVLAPENIFLFGFDFGAVNGKTHFYDSPHHSGIGKIRAYCDPAGNILNDVQDFKHFADKNVFIVGESNVPLPRIGYGKFLEMVGE